jgi:hypothetical protein
MVGPNVFMVLKQQKNYLQILHTIMTYEQYDLGNAV